MSVVTALLGGLMGFLMAYAVVSHSMPRWVRSALTTFSGVAANFAGVPLAFAFIATLGVTGIITKLLKDAFGIDLYGSGFSLYSFAGLVIVYLYFQIPLMILVIAPALDGLRREWREAALNLGAGPARARQLVALLVLMPSLLGAHVAAVRKRVRRIRDRKYALTSGQLPLVPLLIGQVRETGNVLGSPFRRRARPGDGARAVRDDGRCPAAEGVQVAAMKRKVPWWNLLWLVLGSAYFLIPLLATAQFSLQTKRNHYGFEAYGRILRDPLFRSSLAFSFKLAVFTVIIALCLLVPTAYWVHLKLPRLRPVVEFLTILPFVVPAIVLVVGLLGGFRWTPRRLDGDPVWSLLVGPPGGGKSEAINSVAGLSDVHPTATLTEAALSLGAPWRTVLFRVIVPNLRVSILASAFLTVAIVMGEFTMSVLMQFDVRRLYQLRRGDAGDGAARCRPELRDHVDRDAWDLVTRPAARCPPGPDRGDALMAQLELRSVTKRFGTLAALDDAAGVSSRGVFRCSVERVR